MKFHSSNSLGSGAFRYLRKSGYWNGSVGAGRNSFDLGMTFSQKALEIDKPSNTSRHIFITERKRPVTRYRERGHECRVRNRITKVNRFPACIGLISAGLFVSCVCECTRALHVHIHTNPITTGTRPSNAVNGTPGLTTASE